MRNAHFYLQMCVPVCDCFAIRNCNGVANCLVLSPTPHKRASRPAPDL